MAYFILAINYDLTLVYLQLTLVRIILSWLGSVVVCLFIPDFIGTTEEERKATFAPLNLVLKISGTVLITLSLIILDFM